MIITTDNDNKHCRSRTLPATHPRAVTELFLVGKKWNDNSVENKFQTVNNMHNNMQTVFLCDWKGPHPAAQSPWQVLSHPHLLPYPAPSASCLVLNFLLYKPFVATLCGEINFKIKQTCEDELKRGGDLLSWRAQGIMASRGGIGDPSVESLGFFFSHLVHVLTIRWHLSWSWEPPLGNLESSSGSHQAPHVTRGKPSLEPLQNHRTGLQLTHKHFSFLNFATDAKQEDLGDRYSVGHLNREALMKPEALCKDNSGPACYHQYSMSWRTVSFFKFSFWFWDNWRCPLL